jgi:hypothetical protein
MLAHAGFLSAAVLVDHEVLKQDRRIGANPTRHGFLGTPYQVVLIEIYGMDIVPADLETFSIEHVSFLGVEGHANVASDLVKLRVVPESSVEAALASLWIPVIMIAMRASCVSQALATPMKWKLVVGPLTSMRANSGQIIALTRTSIPMRASMVTTASPGPRMRGALPGCMI